MFVKSFRDKKCNGLDKNNAFLLELKCLQKINKYYSCICSVPRKHFPKIVEINNEKKTISLSNRGFSVKDIIEKKINIKPIHIEEQINCIVHNLKKKKIRHLDMCENGKNICVNKKGTISLIDFDYASVGDKYMSDKIKRSVDNFGTYEEYIEIFKEKCNFIIKKVKM